MSMDAAVPCGLILNELVSNALKYAFPDGREGEIRIELRREPGQPGCLSVSDNGVGLPADVTLWSTKSLGLRLVRILAEELGATVEVKSDSGTEVRLSLPAEGPEHKS
jgi:two-component sensor histidine kinase